MVYFLNIQIRNGHPAPSTLAPSTPLSSKVILPPRLPYRFLVR